MALGSTAWVDRNLKSSWDRIAEYVPASWMPIRLPGRKFSIEEFACGHYGCVAPTGEPDVVFKLTSDITEAQFVLMAMSLAPTEGIVKYFKIFALEGQTHRRRDLFVLWREEAWDVGVMFAVVSSSPKAQRVTALGYDAYHIRAINEGAKLLGLFMQWAKDARVKMQRISGWGDFGENREEMLGKIWQAFEAADPSADPQHYRGLPRIGIALRKCYDLAQNMANTDVIYPVGAALMYYMDEGILLADVHLNNIGRDSAGHLLITDPGHAVVFSPRWTTIPQVPVI